MAAHISWFLHHSRSILNLHIQLTIKKIGFEGERETMRLLTHNMLSSNIKGVTNGFPLGLEVVKFVEKEVDFNPDFLKNMFTKIEWKPLVTAARSMGYSELPEEAESSMLESDEFLKKFHHALLELHLEEGALICPETVKEIGLSPSASFIRKYNLKDTTQQMEAVAKAILGILRLRVVREAFHIFPSGYKKLLDYNLVEKLPRGDMILETLSSRIKLLLSPEYDGVGTLSYDAKQLATVSPVSLLALAKLGFVFTGVNVVDEMLVGDVAVGETNPLELAVKQSQCDTSRAETAQATVDQVKIEGVDTNIAVMKELLFPVVESVKCLNHLASWEDPFKSTVFLVLVCYTIYRDWIKYGFSCVFLFLAMLMLWRRHNRGKQLEAFKVTPPPSRNAVEQLLALQEAASHFELFLQSGNILLLKLRALLFSALPQATDKVVVGLIIMAAVFAFVPLRILTFLMLLEVYTREMPLRKDYSERWVRRLREWWIRIPAAPVHLIKQDNRKTK